MKKIFLLFILLFYSNISNAQVSGPHQKNLLSCRSIDGITFYNLQLFEEFAGFPSIVKDTNGILIAAFQWFKAPLNPLRQNSMAVKISYDTGSTWTNPLPVVILNLPPYFQSPFDPALVLTDNGKIRLYFSCSPLPVIDSMVGIYSAISSDGINYSWEPGNRFKPANHHAIAPSVIKLNSSWHLTSPKGAPQDGAFHAISGDGINFIQVQDITSKNNCNWTGNLINEYQSVRFYGTGTAGNPFMWYSSSPNGGIWSPSIAINQTGFDPAVIKIASNDYLMIYTGFNNSNTIAMEEITVANELKIMPNPVKDTFRILCSSKLPLNLKQNDLKIELFSAQGKKIYTHRLIGLNAAIDAHQLKPGLYFARLLNGNNYSAIARLIKL